jgi:hypothetical protein
VPLYAERKRLADLAEAEAAGESFWTEDLAPPVGGKLVYVWEVAITPRGREAVKRFVPRLITRDTGSLEPPDIRSGMMQGPEKLAFSYVEAIYQVAMWMNHSPLAGTASADYDYELFGRLVDEIFSSHRVSFRFVDGEIVPLSSDELHVEVVEPTLRLLHGRKDLDKAHEAYLKALKEISNDDAPDAITDAGTALQETLTALGCTGNALGPLLKSAKAKGLLAGHDQKLTSGIENFIDWASAERSARGDAHKSSPAEREDAWLMVHVVGALIVRLADPSRRHAGAPAERAAGD